MKKIFILIITFFTCYILSGCHQASNNNNANDSALKKVAALQFDSVSIIKEEGNCNRPDSPCVKISLQYPVAKDGLDSVRNNINNVIQQQIIKSLEESGEAKSNNIDSVVNDFIQQFRDFHQQYPAAPISQWEVQVNGKVINNNARVVNIALNIFSYMGGAHPATYYAWLNFGAATGKLLHWQDIVSDTIKMKMLAEKKFRSVHHIKSDASLNSQGFMFDKDQFFLPENFLLCPDSIRFLYNDYEIAAYVYGPQYLTLTKQELDGLLEKK